MGGRGSFWEEYGWGRETMGVADVRRGVDGCWREDKIYGAHTLLNDDWWGDNDERDARSVASESVKWGGRRRR